MKIAQTWFCWRNTSDQCCWTCLSRCPLSSLIQSLRQANDVIFYRPVYILFIKVHVRSCQGFYLSKTPQRHVTHWWLLLYTKYKSEIKWNSFFNYSFSVTTINLFSVRLFLSSARSTFIIQPYLNAEHFCQMSVMFWQILLSLDLLGWFMKTNEMATWNKLY